MLEASELEEILRVGYETRRFEFKGPGDRSDTYFFAKIARAALSLGNLRDGGYVVVGIDDADPAALGPGLDDAQFASWTDYDSVARKMAVYADPPLRFEIQGLGLSSGADVAVIHVFEFSDLPHVCAKGYEPVLRRGALYVRTRKLPETSEVANSVEMRDVLDLATEKGVRRFVQTADRAGLRFDSSGARVSDEEHYENERAESWS
jgi:predicted HTH transcriptional regulator